LQRGRQTVSAPLVRTKILLSGVLTTVVIRLRSEVNSILKRIS